MWAGTLARAGASPRPVGGSHELGRGPHAILRGGDGVLDALRRGLALPLEVTANVLRLTFELRAVALDDADRTGPALAQEALHARAGLLELALDPVAGGGAPALEATEVTLDLLLRGLARGVRARQVGNGLADAVGRGQRGAHGDEHGTLGSLLDLLHGRALLRLAGRGGALGGGAPALGGGAATVCRRAALGLVGCSHLLPHSSRRFPRRGGVGLRARRGP